MTRSTPRTRWTRPLLWAGGGFALAWLLLLDPLGLRPEGSGHDAAPAAETGREVLFYRNPMDPTITSPVPMQDEMGMDYLPVYAEEDGGEEGGGEILFYRNPMDPTITSPVPTQDEMGMDYVPVYADAAPTGGATIRIDPVVVQNMNVQSVDVERRDLVHEIRSVGYLEYDQERMVSVTTRYSGWIEEVYVHYVGAPVRRGMPLFKVYSPELVQTQQELLSAMAYARRLESASPDARARALALVEAARARLGYWDISPEQIASIEASGEVLRGLDVVAPASGVVMQRMAGLEGMAVRPGMETFHIADLSSLWLAVELFEGQMAWVHQGTPARIELAYFPGETFTGTVRFLDPSLSETTRTLKARLGVPNADGRLRPGMFATVTFQPLAARQALTVPALALIRSGQRNVVVVDLGEGRFEPREVELGHQTREFVEVRSGLELGERIVTSAQFLLDSEASLQESIQKMIAQSRDGALGGDHAQ